MKQIICIRKDLNMRKGKMCAQAAHASVKSVIENYTDPDIAEWLASGMTKICVSVNSYAELIEIVEQAQNADLIVALIKDAGRTEFHGIPTVTCAAIGPAENTDLDEITGHLKLL